MGRWQITLETTGGQKYSLPTNNKKEVQQAIYDAQTRLTLESNRPQGSLADQITKLHALKEKGVISEDALSKQKNQLLGLF